jgi:hypothetical protein
MANHALAALESALRVRKLDRTLTTALAPLERIDPSASLPMDVAASMRVCAAAFRAVNSRSWRVRGHRDG